MTANEFDFQYTEGQMRRSSMAECELECSQITETLFVSGVKVAMDYSYLSKHNITRVVNCCNMIVGNVHEDKGVEYLSLHMCDDKSEDLNWFIWSVIAFIVGFEGDSKRGSYNSSSNILIHCEKGISRSCSLVILYLMWK